MSLDEITRTIERALAAAGLEGRPGMPAAVRRTIHEALQQAGLARARMPEPAAATAPPPAGDGRFTAREHAGPHGRRAYKLYVPARCDGTRAVPLVVMLHGCKQDPDDFARGTRLNRWADEQGFIVAWPAQSGSANGSNCWRWFEPQEQVRGGSEPSIIAGIVDEVCAGHPVDRDRVYVAGLSAGAAMALILAETWPQTFAAVAAHSGLPRGAAHDVASAFAAMREGAAGRAAPGGAAVPTIVFHGQADSTVAPANGEAVAARAVALLQAQRGPLERRHLADADGGGTCIRHLDRDGLPVVEHWSVPGGGHAWFGGSAAGSFTSPAGPDASREMLRFFALHARRG